MSFGQWIRSGGVFPHSGTVPLAQSGLKISTGLSPSTLTRSRIDLELSVLATGTGTGVAAGFWSEVLVVAALWWNDSSVVPSSSPTPITNINESPEYVFWDVLHPTVNYLDVATPTMAVTWKSSSGTIESFAQRKGEPTLHNTAWLTWEILDGSGLINTTSSGITYNLGGWYGSNLLYKD
jgi:hypothetical protein